MLFYKDIKTPAIKYGNKNETCAKKLYEKLSNCEIKNVGVLVSFKQPWLCASLDGVVIQDGCVIKIVEIKCPITCEKVKIVDIEKNVCNVSYLIFLNRNIVLKESHMYYTQVQVQMYISGTTVCDFLVYSPVQDGSCIVQVTRDEKFIKSVILQSEQFYFKNYLPALFKQIKKEESDINNVPKRVFTGDDISNVILVHYDTYALSSPLLHGVKLGPERSEGTARAFLYREVSALATLVR